MLLMLQWSGSAHALVTKVGSYMLQDLGGGKGSFLLFTWNRAAMDLRANGFQPSSEALGDHAFRLKGLADMLPSMVSTEMIGRPRSMLKRLISSSWKLFGDAKKTILGAFGQRLMKSADWFFGLSRVFSIL